MLNQPQPVFSYTIPYYSTNYGESSELFVSEKTYESFLLAQQKIPITVLSGDLHPLSKSYGEVTSTLFDTQKAIIILGSRDIEEYTNEVMDICLATELERILMFSKEEFTRYLYHDQTPAPIQIFIDDLQQTLEDIVIGKQLLKKDYRIIEREEEIMNDVLKNSQSLTRIKKENPYSKEEALFLLTKLLYLDYVDQTHFKKYKHWLQPLYPRLFVEYNQLQKHLKKMKLATPLGRQKAVEKILKSLNYEPYIKKITINDIPLWELPLQ